MMNPRQIMNATIKQTLFSVIHHTLYDAEELKKKSQLSDILIEAIKIEKLTNPSQTSLYHDGVYYQANPRSRKKQIILKDFPAEVIPKIEKWEKHNLALNIRIHNTDAYLKRAISFANTAADLKALLPGSLYTAVNLSKVFSTSTYEAEKEYQTLHTDNVLQFKQYNQKEEEAIKAQLMMNILLT